MESGFRTQSNVFILLFHLLAFGTLAGDILYQRYNVATVGSQTWAGRLKYLTYIDEVLQSLYFLLSFVADIYLLLKIKANQDKYLGIVKLQDFMFAVVVLPLGMLVCSVFWSIYAIDRELIYPEILDTIIPKLCNHIMHTAVAIFLILETFLVRHRFPDNTTSLSGIMLVGLSYFFWMVWQKYFLLEWPYPFLDDFTVLHHLAFILICFAFQCSFYFLAKYCVKFRETMVTSCSDEKSKKKSN
ncbi:androgen-induced gene 1 protein-like [Dendronephthya gigantea]|uniref:androgen-induced gene 1 protein-like n=1 Tax=Dendronephthya gigantea TaxID=151771 RepID=UPI00106B84C2|nr:androgen-induced gene 1 protein-like [Dendronephthya gigantea]